MPETVEVPVSLLERMTEASEAFHNFEDELEDFLISKYGELLARLFSARAHHIERNVHPVA